MRGRNRERFVLGRGGIFVEIFSDQFCVVNLERGRISEKNEKDS